MKRVLIIAFIMCSLLFSGCNNSSIGIIGGADGPTSIIIGKESKDSIRKPIRMIKVEGKLYYDSGEVSDITPRCGTMDGELKRTVPDYEIPRNDNECNFEGADGYQNATSITKELNIDGKWVIFKLFDAPELDMAVFKYCYYIKGCLPNARRDGELVVLTDNIDYSFEDYEKLFSSQANPSERHYNSTFRLYGDYDEWGIYLTANNVTSSGLTLLCEQFGGSAEGEIQTGEAFLLESVKNDEWQAVDTIIDEYAWNAIAYYIKENDITEFKIDWEWLYGELPPGYYRLKKEFMDFRATGDYEKKMYEAYFTVE